MATLSKNALDTGLPANFTPLRLHIEQLALLVEKANLEKAGALWNSLGSYLDDIADYPGANVAYEKAVRINEVATFYWEMVFDRHEMGNYTVAKNAFEQALRFDEAAFGPNHPDVARDVNNLGSVLRAQGDYAGARVPYEQALRIDEAAFGLNHPNVATDVTNLGRLLADSGDLDAGIQHLERALQIFVATLPENHPNIWTVRNSLNHFRVQKIIRDEGVSKEEAVEILKRRFGGE